MENVFINMFNMSITASWIVLAIILLRLLLKKAPRAILCALWSLVAVRLFFPFSIESALSLIPSVSTVPQEIVYAREPVIDSGVTVINEIVNPIIISSFAPPDTLTSINPIQVWLAIMWNLWVLGIIAMLIYAIVSYLRLRIRTRVAIETEKGIFICDNIQSPFILGIFKPRILLPSSMDESHKKHVIAHEKAHLKRLDHLWKPIGFALLTVYWFNPVLWVAYILFCRDIELACDEHVIKDMGEYDKKEYSTALLACSIPKKMITACPLAFGEVGVKERIKGVLNYKKPAFWLIVVAVVISVVIAVCFLTNPMEESNNAGTEDIAIGEEPANTSVSFVGGAEGFENEFAVSKAFVFAGVTVNYDLYSDAINADKQRLDGEEFLPLHKFESVNDITAFKEKFSDFQFSHTLDLPKFDDIAAEYDEDFFKDNILLITHVVTQGIGNCLINTGNVSKENVTFYISKSEEKGSDALYGWLLCIGVNRRFVDSNTQFDAVVINEGSIIGTWFAPASVVGLNVSEIPENARVYFAFYEDGTGAEWNNLNANVAHINADMYRREFTYTEENGILTITYLNDSRLADDDFKQFRYNISGGTLTLSDINANRILELTRIIREPEYSDKVEVAENDTEIRFFGANDFPKNPVAINSFNLEFKRNGVYSSIVFPNKYFLDNAAVTGLGTLEPVFGFSIYQDSLNYTDSLLSLLVSCVTVDYEENKFDRLETAKEHIYIEVNGKEAELLEVRQGKGNGHLDFYFKFKVEKPFLPAEIDSLKISVK